MSKKGRRSELKTNAMVRGVLDSNAPIHTVAGVQYKGAAPVFSGSGIYLKKMSRGIPYVRVRRA